MADVKPKKPKQWRDAIEVPVTIVHENTWNPNTVPEPIMAALRENVLKAGFNQPIVVRPHPTIEGDYEVVDGAHRFRTAQDLGMVAVPVIVRDFTDAEARAQTLAMNRLHGDMDPAEVARVVREIESDGIDLSELTHTGYQGFELTTMLEDFPEPSDPLGAAEAAGAEQSGRGRGNAIISYNLVFDDPDQQATWFAFVRHLKAHYEGETVAERLTTFLTANVLPKDDE